MKTQACTPSDLTRQTDISFFMYGPLRFSSFKSTRAGLLLSLAGRWAAPPLAGRAKALAAATVTWHALQKSLAVPGDGNRHCSTALHLHLILAQPLRSPSSCSGLRKRQDAFSLKGQKLLFCTARSHVCSGGYFPPFLLQHVVCPITLLRILSGILSSAFSKTGLRENLFAHVNTNRFNMLRTREIPARVRKARGSPKLQQFSLGRLRRITWQSHWTQRRRALQRCGVFFALLILSLLASATSGRKQKT